MPYISIYVCIHINIYIHTVIRIYIHAGSGEYVLRGFPAARRFYGPIKVLLRLS